jgi:hypothetical protein
VGVKYQNSDVYSGGALFYDNTEAIPPGSAWIPSGMSDLAFKTYVAPPLPPATPSGPAPPTVTKKKCKKHKKRAAAVAQKHCKKKH